MKLLATISLALLYHFLPAFAGDETARGAKPPAKKAAAKCPICCKDVNPKCTAEYEGTSYAFNSGACRNKWKKQRAESLYQRLGGKPAMDAAVSLFYKKVLADKRINGFFEDVDMKRQARKQKAFLSAAFGGPEPWKGKDMRRAHANLVDLEDCHFDAVAENLKATLTELKIDEKLIKEVMTIAGSLRDDVLNKKKSSPKEDEKTDGAKPTKKGEAAPKTAN